MDAKKCDRCGKFYTREKDKQFGVILKNIRGEYGMLGRTEGELYDLCHACMKDFERWLENENTETAADA